MYIYIIFVGQTYKELHKVAKEAGSRFDLVTKSRDKVKFLNRVEFLQETLQNHFMSVKEPDECLVSRETHNPRDTFLDRPDYDEEEVKAVQMHRRDFAVIATDSYFVYDILHQRSFAKYQCNNRPLGLIEAVTCNDPECKTTGPCFHHFSTIATLNCPK